MTRALIILSLLATLQSECSIAGDWFVGITGGPTMSVPQSTIVLPSPSTRFNYSVGVVGTFELDPAMSIEGRLLYRRMDILLATNVPDTRQAIDPNTGRIDPSRILYADASEVYESVSVPITFNYAIAIASDFDLMLTAGVEIGYLYQWQAILEEMTLAKLSAVQTESDFTYGFSIGPGFSYSVSTSTTFVLVPRYSYLVYPERMFGTLSFHNIELECSVMFRL